MAVGPYRGHHIHQIDSTFRLRFGCILVADLLTCGRTSRMGVDSFRDHLRRMSGAIAAPLES